MQAAAVAIASRYRQRLAVDGKSPAAEPTRRTHRRSSTRGLPATSSIGSITSARIANTATSSRTTGIRGTSASGISTGAAGIRGASTTGTSARSTGTSTR